MGSNKSVMGDRKCRFLVAELSEAEVRRVLTGGSRVTEGQKEADQVSRIKKLKRQELLIMAQRTNTQFLTANDNRSVHDSSNQEPPKNRSTTSVSSHSISTTQPTLCKFPLLGQLNILQSATNNSLMQVRLSKHLWAVKLVPLKETTTKISSHHTSAYVHISVCKWFERSRLMMDTPTNLYWSPPQ